MKLNKLFHIFVFSIIAFWGIINAVYADTSPSTTGVSVLTGALSNQLNIYGKSFERIDTLMSLPQDERILMRYQNRTAYTGAGQQVFSPTFIPDEKAGIWAKSYSLFENIPLGNGPNISNVAYGTIIGYDTELKHLKHNCDGELTFHIAYGGSRENYNQVSSIDNVGNVGITGAIFKNKFFSALTLGAGGANTNDNTSNGEQSFNTLLAGAAWKTGYNIELKKGKYIIQPSFLATYAFDKVFNFKNAKNKDVRVDPIHAVQVIPELKVIGNFKGGWQPYLAFSYIWNLMDSPAVYENEVLQPRINFAPYCEYGAGIQRKWREHYTSFGQVIMRGGGRNGVSFYVGFRRAFGGK